MLWLITCGEKLRRFCAARRDPPSARLYLAPALTKFQLNKVKKECCNELYLRSRNRKLKRNSGRSHVGCHRYCLGDVVPLLNRSFRTVLAERPALELECGHRRLG